MGRGTSRRRIIDQRDATTSLGKPPSHDPQSPGSSPPSGSRACRTVVSTCGATTSAWEWFLTPACCTGLEEMAAMLRGWPASLTTCILMGEVVPGLDTSKPHLRRWANADAATNSLMNSTASGFPSMRRAPVPAPLGRGENPLEAGTFVRDRLLPPEFAGIDGIVGLSAEGLGSKPKRGCDCSSGSRKHSLLDLRQWAKGAQAAGCPVDPVLFRGGHPVYTSRPLFTGMPDPVPEELYAAILPGIFGDRVDLVADRFAQRIDQPTPVNGTVVYGALSRRIGASTSGRRSAGRNRSSPR